MLNKVEKARKKKETKNKNKENDTLVFPRSPFPFTLCFVSCFVLFRFFPPYNSFTNSLVPWLNKICLSAMLHKYSSTPQNAVLRWRRLQDDGDEGCMYEDKAMNGFMLLFSAGYHGPHPWKHSWSCLLACCRQRPHRSSLLPWPSLPFAPLRAPSLP